MGDTDIDLTAAGWARRAAEGLDTREEAELRAWVVADPRHAGAVLAASQAWAALGQLADDPALTAERERALGIRLVPASAERTRVRSTSRRMAAAMAAAACIAVVLVPVALPLPAAAYSTARGERLTVPLRGGGNLDLNSGTRVEVGGTWLRPHVRLIDGEMLVSAGSRVSAVSVEAGDVTLAVAAASVAVRDTGRAILLRPVVGTVTADVGGTALPTVSPGVQQMVTADLRIRHIDDRSGKAIAWRQGRIILDRTSVADALAEFQRYGRVPVTVDTAVAGLAVSGIYRTDALLPFLDALVRIHPVRWEREAGGIRVSAA